MRRVLYGVLAYFGLGVLMALVLAGGMLVEWLRDRSDRRTCARVMDPDQPSPLETCERILALGTWEPRP